MLKHESTVCAKKAAQEPRPALRASARLNVSSETSAARRRRGCTCRQLTIDQIPRSRDAGTGMCNLTDEGCMQQLSMKYLRDGS